MIINPFAVMELFEDLLETRNISSEKKIHNYIQKNLATRILPRKVRDFFSRWAHYILDEENQLEIIVPKQHHLCDSGTALTEPLPNVKPVSHMRTP